MKVSSLQTVIILESIKFLLKFKKYEQLKNCKFSISEAQMRMSGAGTLCAFAHCRSFLFIVKKDVFNSGNKMMRREYNVKEFNLINSRPHLLSRLL